MDSSPIEKSPADFSSCHMGWLDQVYQYRDLWSEYWHLYRFGTAGKHCPRTVLNIMSAERLINYLSNYCRMILLCLMAFSK
jgi:hypothetical protein